MSGTDWCKRGVRVRWGEPGKPSVVGNHGVVVSVNKGLALVRLDSGADVYLTVDRLRPESADE